MIGVDASTGRALGGTDHLLQSIADILMTPIGTRVARRDYGSALFELVDVPMNGLGRLRLFAAIATAIARWEPRLRLTRLALDRAGADGTFTVRLEGERTDEPDATELTRLTLPLRLTS